MVLKNVRSKGLLNIFANHTLKACSFENSALCLQQPSTWKSQTPRKLNYMKDSFN